jgi:glycerol-3-phosphate cytidylyltransferase
MKIGFNCSSFDLLHAGHVTMLKMEKERCDYLKVALQTDPTIDRQGIKNKPVQSIYERYVQLQACKYVDEILVYDTEAELLNLIMTQTIHIRFLSEEYLNRDFTGKQYCIDRGIELYYHPREHTYSSSDLRLRTYELEKARAASKDAESELLQHSPDLIVKEKHEEDTDTDSTFGFTAKRSRKSN